MSNDGCNSYGTQCRDTGKQLTADSVAFDDRLIESGCASVQCVLDKTIINGREHVEDKDNPHEVNISQVPHGLNDHNDASFPTPLDGQVITYVEANNAFEAQTIPAGVTDHLLLTNIGTNTHEIIDEHIANITLNPHQITPALIGAEPENANIQAHISDILTNPHQITYINIIGPPPASGFKNILINGNNRINQREFDGDWNSHVVGEFGYDRWAKDSASHREQRIEIGNWVEGETYILTYDNGDGQFDSIITFDGGTLEGQSGVSGIIGSSNVLGYLSVVVPQVATNVQLERGSIRTYFDLRNIQQELAMCQRFYWQESDVNIQMNPPNAESTFRTVTIWYPVKMRAVPAVTDTINTGTTAPAHIRDSHYRGQVDIGNTTTSTSITSFIINAEL